MTPVRRFVIVPHPCEAMFDLVDDFERYPEFLPWCSAAEVLERTDDVDVARLQIQYRGLKTRITTRNLKERPHRMVLEFVEGPFSRFGGQWRFQPLGADGCRVDFELDYAFSTPALHGLLEPVFGFIAETLVESFVQRAERMAGGGAP